MRRLKPGDVLIAKKTSYMDYTKDKWLTKGKRYKISLIDNYGAMFKSDYADDHYVSDWESFFKMVQPMSKNIKIL